VAVSVCTVSACSSGVSGAASGKTLTAGFERGGHAGIAAKLKVETVAGGLKHGWDVGFLPDGKVLVTERPGTVKLLSGVGPNSTVQGVQVDMGDVMVNGEGGLMGLLVHPDFATSRRFTTCQTNQQGSQPVDIRLVTWKLAEDGAQAEKEKDLLTGLPLNPSGRHSGCRLLVGPEGKLYVGTGDIARAGAAQDRKGLGGKVLRLDLLTGEPAPDNPFISSSDRNERLIWTYGHRNIQGIARRPGTDEIYTVEHGPDRDDEVNIIRAGGNYGWDPSRGGTQDNYDESVPMTDKERFPQAIEAMWSSGEPTEATCGAAFLPESWGDMAGQLVVPALKGAKVLLFTFGPNGKITDVGRPAELNETNGRLRAAAIGPDGALYITTSNGNEDKLLRVTRA
jgi:glucose/arabinose dehydrogenase